MAMYHVTTRETFWQHRECWPEAIDVFFRAALQIHRAGAAEAHGAGAIYLIPSVVAIWVEDHYTGVFETAARTLPDIVRVERKE